MRNQIFFIILGVSLLNGCAVKHIPHATIQTLYNHKTAKNSDLTGYSFSLILSRTLLGFYFKKWRV